MGRKSRLKRERRELKLHGLSEHLADNLFVVSEHQGSVYRFFSEEWQADALASGKVWISTLEICRTYEDPEQGDPQEAIEAYYSGHATGHGNNADFVEIAKRTGIVFGPECVNGTISNNVNIGYLPDAYVLCTTVEFSPDKLSETFGHYCVEITDPFEFFLKVSSALEKHESIHQAATGKVTYKDRAYTGLQDSPGPIGFVKPVDKYAPQKEFRFLWVPENMDILNPVLLHCPEVKSMCRRIA